MAKNLSSKQRSRLMSLAANLTPVGQIGKEGIGTNMLDSFSECLEKRELIKIDVLDNAPSDAKTLGQEVAKALGAECVTVIGRKVVLYRKSKRDIDHIKLDV